MDLVGQRRGATGCAAFPGAYELGNAHSQAENNCINVDVLSSDLMSYFPITYAHDVRQWLRRRSRAMGGEGVCGAPTGILWSELPVIKDSLQQLPWAILPNPPTHYPQRFPCRHGRPPTRHHPCAANPNPTDPQLKSRSIMSTPERTPQYRLSARRLHNC